MKSDFCAFVMLGLFGQISSILVVENFPKLSWG